MSDLKHVKAYTFWRTNARSIQRTAKTLHHGQSTIVSWRDEEEWIRRADEEERRLAAKVTAEQESGLMRHTREMEALIMLGRAVVAEAAKEIARRYQHVDSTTGRPAPMSVDSGEVRDIIQSIAAVERTAASFYGIEGVKRVEIEHTGSIKVVSTEELKMRVAGYLEEHPEYALALTNGDARS